MPVEFVKISSLQLEALPKEKTVFFFPVGPLEDHGPHLPMGLDLEEAERSCFLLAQHLELEMPGWVGVLMPKAPLGIDSNTNRYAIRVRPHVLRDWLVDACRSLVQMDYFHFVGVTGHLGPRQLTAIEEAGWLVRRLKRRGILDLNRISRKPRPSLISVSSAGLSPKECLSSPFWADSKEHGGERDTSVALALFKDQVDPSYQALPSMPRDPSWLSRSWNRYFGKTRSYWGDPSLATSEGGERLLLDRIEEVFPKMRAVWEGANPKYLFKSWYSIIPTNKSFFKSWVLVVLIGLLFAIWFYLTAFQFEF